MKQQFFSSRLNQMLAASLTLLIGMYVVCLPFLPGIYKQAVNSLQQGVQHTEAQLSRHY